MKKYPPGLNPSALVIHTGTNDVEQQSIDTCFDNFKTLIDLSTQKYPTSKLILSSLTARSGDYDAKGVQLNNGLSRLRSYANVHFVNNKNITKEMLHDRKHIKRRKIGTLVANIKDCLFNRISRKSSHTPPAETKPRSDKTSDRSDKSATSSYNHSMYGPPPLMSREQSRPNTRPHKTYAGIVTMLDPTTTSDTPTEFSKTLLQLLNLCDMIRQN